MFLSYRNMDTGDLVPKLSERLRTDLRSDSVFRDQEDLVGGEPWFDVIQQWIRASDVVLFLIGPEWTGDTGSSRRIDEADDMVRTEVELALSPPSRATAVPILVDGTTPPTHLPGQVGQLFRQHALPINRSEIEASGSAGYESILVAIWFSLRDRVIDGVLLVADEGPALGIRFDNFIAELRSKRGVEAEELSRYVAGAAVLSVRQRKKKAKKWPDVIVLVGDEPSETLLARIDAISRNPAARSVALVGVGAVATYTAVGLAGVGTATGQTTGAGASFSTYASGAQLSSSVAPGLGVTAGVKAGLQGASTAAKAVIAVPVVVAAGVTATQLLPSDDPLIGPALAGSWNVPDFNFVSAGNVNEASFNPVPGQAMTFEPLNDDCTGEGCPVKIVEGPPFLVGTELRPTEDSLEAELAVGQSNVIRQIAGGLFCGGIDVIEETDVFFAARELADGTLSFEVRLEPPVDTVCGEASITWSATATPDP